MEIVLNLDLKQNLLSAMFNHLKKKITAFLNKIMADKN